MLKKCLYVSCNLFFLSTSTFAWNATGHKITAEIAYAHLNAHSLQIVDTLSQTMSFAKSGAARFAYLSIWPDTLRYQNNHDYDAWHFIDYPFVKDNVTPKNFSKDNVVSAILYNTHILQDPKKSLQDRAKALSFVVHFIGDIHQPMHCVTLYSLQFQNGDRGGNAYRLQDARVDNLHQLWDQGVFWYQGKSAQVLAENLQASYPESDFTQALLDQTPNHWALASFQLAKQAYSVPYDGVLTDEYVKLSQIIVQQQLVLAGYRLANWLNLALTNTQDISNGNSRKKTHFRHRYHYFY